MPALVLTKTEGLSIGALPLPAGWTIDVSSHTVPCCVRRSQSGPAQPPSCYEGTMNVLRCESRERPGVALHVAEYFRPRLYNQTSRSAAYSLSDEDMQKALQAMPPFRPERPPLLARAVEITDDLLRTLPLSRQRQHPSSSLLRETEAPRGGSAATLNGPDDAGVRVAVDCIAARLLPSYHIFVQVVLDSSEGASREMEQMAETVLQEATKRYVQPLMELPHFRAVVDPNTALVEVNGRSPGDSLSRRLVRGATEEEVTTLSLRQPCSPLTLSESGMPCMGVFCKAARAVVRFRRLYTTRLTSTTKTADGLHRARSERVDVSLFHTHWNVRRQYRRSPDGPPVTPAEALRQLVRHSLKLHTEGLVVEIPVRMLEKERSSEAMLHPIAIATLPVAQHPLFSLYNYRSVEAILEAHIAAQSVVAEQGWRLEPIDFLKNAGRFVPSVSLVEAMEAEDGADTVVPSTGGSTATDGDGSAAEAWASAMDRRGRVPPRCSFYVLEPRHDATAATAGSSGSQAVGYVVGLVAPRLASEHALVVVTPLHPDHSHESAAATGADSSHSPSAAMSAAASREAILRATCHFMIEEMRVTTPLSCDWGSLCQPTANTTAGAVFRQGELVLEVPAEDARYHNAVVVPTAAYFFTTRGSLTVYVQPSLDPVSTSAELSAPSRDLTALPMTSDVSTQPLPFACLSAAWTVVADGRSAMEYIDYTISEYQYDLGVKNLSNVGARSQLDRPGTLVVRQRKQHARKAAPRNAAFGSLTTATAAGSAPENRTTALLSGGVRGMGETWSVWLDVGVTKRLFVMVCEGGLGQLVVVQAALPASAHGSAASTVSASQEEQFVEAWVRDVPVAVIPRL